MTYRVREGLPFFNKLVDSLELWAEQIADYLSRPCKGLAEGFSFREDLLPACTRVGSTIPQLTLMKSLLELLRSGGSYTFLRKSWGCFRATLGPENALDNHNWSRAESLVSFFCMIRDYIAILLLGYKCLLYDKVAIRVLCYGNFGFVFRRWSVEHSFPEGCVCWSPVFHPFATTVWSLWMTCLR